MRNNLRRRTPQFETMESMTLLSGLSALASVPPPLPARAAEVHTEAFAPRVALNVTARGFWFHSTSHVIPDVGLTDNVLALGRGRGLGEVAVTGSLHSVGFIQEGHATGTLMIRTLRGNLTVDLIGPTQQGFSPLPTLFGFTVTGGTGRFRNATGMGTLTAVLRPDRYFAGPANVDGIGALTMIFRPGRVLLV